MYIGIVADDLTGAADAAAPFAKRGLQAGVGIALPGKPTFRMEACDALAYDTETREMPPENSVKITRLTRAATRRFLEFGPVLLYKKIDSTLRGHLRLELDAMRRELPGRLAVVCPAFPANGRTVVRGVLHIHGVPWTETDFAPSRSLDSDMPTVRAAFAGAQDIAVAEMGLDTLRQWVQAAEALWQRMMAQGIHTVFCDAVTQADLEILAQAILRQPQRYLPVGSAGFSAALAAWLPDPPSPAAPATEKAEDVFATGRVLVAVGSRHPISRRQAMYLAERAGILPVLLHKLTEAEEAAAQIRAQWEAGQRVVLLITPASDVPNGSALFQAAALSLHKQCARHGKKPVEALITTGGETAIQFCHAFGGMGLYISGETQPGVVRGYLHSAEKGSAAFQGLPIITKAGGFGTEETLARCVGLV